MDTAELLRRLRHPDSLSGLARLAAAELLDTPLGELVRPGAAAQAIVSLSVSHLSAPGSERPIEELIERGLARLEAEARPLHEWLPRELQDALRELAGRHHTFDREVVLTVLDQEPLRAAVRELLRESLLGFGERLRTPVTESAVARGLGSIGRFARDQAIARSGAIGSIAASVTSAVGAEVERQLDRRAAEYADAVLSGVIERIADRASDPARAAERAALRTALLEGALDLYTDELAAELRRGEPASAARTIRRALLAWLSSASAGATLTSALSALIEASAERPLRATLEELGLAGGFEEAAVELLRARLGPLVESDAFATWLGRVLSAPRAG